MMIPSGCGVFGIIRKETAKKIPGSTVVRAIERVRHRGSDKGAGFATFNLGEGNSYVIKLSLRGTPQRLLDCSTNTVYKLPRLTYRTREETSVIAP